MTSSKSVCKGGYLFHGSVLLFIFNPVQVVEGLIQFGTHTQKGVRYFDILVNVKGGHVVV